MSMPILYTIEELLRWMGTNGVGAITSDQMKRMVHTVMVQKAYATYWELAYTLVMSNDHPAAKIGGSSAFEKLDRATNVLTQLGVDPPRYLEIRNKLIEKKAVLK